MALVLMWPFQVPICRFILWTQPADCLSLVGVPHSFSKSLFNEPESLIFFSVLEIEFWVLCMLDKCCTVSLYSLFLILQFYFIF